MVCVGGRGLFKLVKIIGSVYAYEIILRKNFYFEMELLQPGLVMDKASQLWLKLIIKSDHNWFKAGRV